MHICIVGETCILLCMRTLTYTSPPYINRVCYPLPLSHTHPRVVVELHALSLQCHEGNNEQWSVVKVAGNGSTRARSDDVEMASFTKHSVPLSPVSGCQVRDFSNRGRNGLFFSSKQTELHCDLCPVYTVTGISHCADHTALLMRHQKQAVVLPRALPPCLLCLLYPLPPTLTFIRRPSYGIVK